MITEHDLREAIAECEGIRNPNASTCIKLAAFYIIWEHLYGQPSQSGYSFAEDPQSNVIKYDSGTEFSQAIYGRRADDVMPVLDDLMTALQVVNPRLYASVMRKLEGESM